MVPLFVLFVLAFLATFLGALHPILDATSVLRMPLAWLLVAFLIFARRHRWLLIPGALAVGTLLWHYTGWHRTVPTGGSLTLFQHNLYFKNRSPEDVITEIERRDPDVITFQEVAARTEFILTRLAGRYPHQHRCRVAEDIYDMAVLSKLPLADGSPVCSPNRGLAALQVASPAGDVWIVSIHLPWPWPFDQPSGLAGAKDTLATLDGPKIVAGDFNNVPWSHAVKSTATAVGARYLGPRRNTFEIEVSGIELPLDHVLAPSGQVERLGKLGSDHNALFARVGF
ncbi:MAG: endonuclease/exonuclease/phosphatase family protein [Pseudomonadota bacterium]